MLAKINWQPSHKDLRIFGLTILIGFAIIGGIGFFFGKIEFAKWAWILSGLVCLLAVTVPPIAKPFYWIWMGIAFVMGSIISFLIVALIYYFIITPVGLFMKIIGRDALKLKKKSFSGNTYWHDHPDISKKESYERLF